MRVNVIFTLGLGSTAEGITKVANDESVDFIIIARYGDMSRSTKIKQTDCKVLGSVARRVSELAEPRYDS